MLDDLPVGCWFLPQKKGIGCRETGNSGQLVDLQVGGWGMREREREREIL